MESHASATSWLVFGGVVAFGCWYYYPRQQPKPQKPQEEPQQHVTAAKRKQKEQDERGRQGKRAAGGATSESDTRPQVNGSGSPKKRKAPVEPARSVPAVSKADDKAEDDDVSTRKWAEGMIQAQKGHDIGATKGSKEAKVKTVKQSTAQSHPVLSSGSSQGGAEADDDLSPVPSPRVDAGGVSDMLEPQPKGPTALRLTAPAKPQKERVARQPKEEVVETKKQRQNRKKVEERRLQREGEEQQRRKLEESQRRAAREARGEPAKNGLAAAKAPAVSAWMSSTSTNDAPFVNGTQNVPLLDTFDAESMSSSNGGLDPSTGPTSTTSAARYDPDLPSEEDQIAQAMKQSEDESGWQTVSQPKKSKKKIDTSLADPVLGNKTNVSAPAKKAAVNGKPTGFQALEVEYEQRGDADPNEPSNWDA